MSDTRQVHLTAEGKRQLEGELNLLRGTRRQEVADRIQQAISFGDISESGEYEDAKNEQARIEGRIRELEITLANAILINDNVNSDKSFVRLGAKVTIVDDDGYQETWHIVSSPEANSRENKISNESLVGQALIGKRKGEKVAVVAPAGVMHFTILSIE